MMITQSPCRQIVECNGEISGLIQTLKKAKSTARCSFKAVFSLLEMAFSASNLCPVSHLDKKVTAGCSANSLLAPNSNLTMINSDTLIEHMQGSACEWFALRLHGLSYRKYSGRRGTDIKCGGGCTALSLQTTMCGSVKCASLY